MYYKTSHYFGCFVQAMPGGGFETVKMELPHNWNQLLQEKGYKPISEFYIK